MAQTNELNLGVSNASGLLNYTQPTDVKPLPALGNLSTSQTVQGQLGNITATNDQGVYTNPLMTRATTRANQAANKRGLLNTSMANQAGQEAVLSAALPIAQADAKAYQTQGLANQNAMNTFGTAAQAQGFKADSADQAYSQQIGTGDYASEIVDSTGAVTTPAGSVGGGGLLQSKADIDATARDQLYEQTVGTGDYASQVVDSTGAVTQAAGNIGGGGTITAKNDALLTTQDDAQLHDTVMKGLDENMRGNLLSLESNFNSLAQTSRSASTIYSSFLTSLVAIQQDATLSPEAKTTVIADVWGKAEDSIEVLMAFDSAALGVQQQVSDLQPV
jgi:hypothetical protein